ncbi:hypothetical protein [Paenibacillus sp. HB172176]|uniref:hypothetical protein n=1 Tax=Paenibacillus sp. HB172176 TaxID=2493690 RepID=UPI00143A1BCA|nr:hypothetical protein [Paenibacillus sp. HB172176]
MVYAVAFMRRRSKWQCIIAAVCLSLLFLLTTGCAGESEQEKRSYGQDGYMGLSNSNPNTINRHSTQSYSEDIAFVKQVLEPVEGIKKIQVGFNGSELNVLLTPEKGLSDANRDWIRDKAEQIVQHNLPDYHVHVRID